MGGKHSTGNEFMETAAVTVALTMPNVLVDTSGLKSQVKLVIKHFNPFIPYGSRLRANLLLQREFRIHSK